MKPFLSLLKNEPCKISYMLKITFLVLLIIVTFPAFGADTTTREANKLRQQLAADACNCIDSIQTNSKSKEEINAAVRACIDRQVAVYQLGLKLLKTDTSNSDSVKIDSNSDSDEYRSGYFELERSLMNTCKVLQQKISIVDNIKDFSISENVRALEYYAEGQKQTERGNYTQATISYQKAVKTDPLFAFAWDNLGICYQHLGRYSEAIQTYQRSLCIDSTGLLPLQNMAFVYRIQKNYRAATDTYLQMAKLSPDNPEAYYGLAVVQYNAEEYESGLINACRAYKLYLNSHSPYRVDAENLISQFYDEMSANNQSDDFRRIMKEHNMQTQ